MLGVGHTPPLNEPTVSSLSPALLCLSPLSRQTSVSGPQPPEERTPLLRLFSPAEMPSPAKLTSSMAHPRGTFSRKPVPLSPGGPGHPPTLFSVPLAGTVAGMPVTLPPDRPHSPVLVPGGVTLAPESLWCSGVCLSLGPSWSDLTGLGMCSGTGGRVGYTN